MKRLTKFIVSLICTLIVLPAALIYRLQYSITGSDRVFSGWSQLFSLIPGLPGIYLRAAFYRLTAGHCGADACISFGSIFSHPDVFIGRTVYVGNFCSIGKVVIEDDVLIASHVSIMNGCRQHGIGRLDIPVREQPGTCELITIGADSWIGERATVAASVGKHAVVGAGALVLEPVPDFAVVVGVPARVIRDRRHGHFETKMPDIRPSAG